MCWMAVCAFVAEFLLLLSGRWNLHVLFLTLRYRGRENNAWKVYQTEFLQKKQDISTEESQGGRKL